MPGIGLITNPRSRANIRDPSKPRKLGYLIGSHGTAQATRSLDDLYRVCEEFKKERIEILGISGGDGTMHHTLTAMIQTYGAQPLPLVAILRGGTMNTIANSLGIYGETPQLLFELVDKHRRGLTDSFDVFDQALLQVGDRYGFIFGAGIIYNFLHEYYATGNPSPQTAARLMSHIAVSTLVRGALSKRITKRVRTRVIVDGDPWACSDFSALTASVVEQIGLGFRPFYRCNERPGAFALLGLHTSPFGVLVELPRVRAGLPIRRDKVIDAIAEEAILSSEEPIDYMVDGDTYRADGHLQLRTGPRLRFIRLTGNTQGEAELPDTDGRSRALEATTERSDSPPPTQNRVTLL